MMSTANKQHNKFFYTLILLSWFGMFSLSSNAWAIAEGELITSFAETGKLIQNLTDQHYISDVAVREDGKILVTGWAITERYSGVTTNGHSYNYFSSDIFLAQFTEQGELDTTFGQDADGDDVKDGYVILNLKHTASGLDADLPDQAETISLGADGFIYVAGTTEANRCGGCKAFFVAKFDANGALDPSFGEDVDGDGDLDGYQSHSFIGSDEVNDIVVDVSGAIYVLGTTVQYGDVFLVAKLTPAGELDSNFGPESVGFNIAGNPAIFGQVRIASVVQENGRMARQADGKIVIGGKDSYHR